MRRRHFLGLLTGAPTLWPLAAGAQQPDRMRRIGIIQRANQENAVVAFRHALQEMGWIQGGNLEIFDWRISPDGDSIDRELLELLALTPDVIVVAGGTVERLLRITRTVPVVFVIVPDPVGSG